MQLSSIENISEDNIIFHEPKEFQLRNTSILVIAATFPTKLWFIFCMNAPLRKVFGVKL